MKKTIIIKKMLLRAFIGVFIGIAIGQIISIITSLSIGGEEFSPCAPDLVTAVGSENAATALQSLLCGIMGMGFAAASVVWELDNINIAAQTGICFLIYAVFMLPIAYFAYWMEHSVIGFLTYFGIFAVIFVTMWIGQYFVWRKKVKEINDGLKQ